MEDKFYKKFFMNNRSNINPILHSYFIHSFFVLLKNLFQVFFLFSILLSLPGCSPNKKIPPKAIKGVLDLRDWDFEKDGIINLDGEWEFYWEEALSVPEIHQRQSCFQSNESDCKKNFLTEKIQFIHTPSLWNDFLYEKRKDDKLQNIKIDSKGYATYYLKLTNIPLNNIFYQIPHMGTAYDLYINNKYIIGGRKFSSNPDNEIIEKKIQFVNIIKDGSEVEIILHISNYNHIKGGFWETILMGSQEEILSSFHKKIASSFAIFGILVIMGMYHIGLFLSRRNEPSTLYFGIFCLLLSMRHYYSDICFGYTYFPRIEYFIGIKIEYSVIYILPTFLVLYINSIFKNNYKFFSRILIIVSIFTFLVGLISNTYYLTYIFDLFTYYMVLIFIYLILVILYGIRNKLYGSSIFLIVIPFMFLVIINDILLYLAHIRSINLSGHGFIFFIFSQSYLLSERFSKAFQEVETLSGTLRESNRELELTKERATKAYLDLEASQKQLVQSDKMITLGTMLAGVAHEINTPLGAIKANSENILESLKALLLKLNPSLHNLTLEELQTSLKILEISQIRTTALSSKETRAVRKKVISLLEEEKLSNVEALADYVVELNLIEALEKKEEILKTPHLERVLSIASDLHGIRKKSTVIQTSAERVSKIVKSLKSFMHFDQNEKKVPADLTEGMETVLIILHNKIKLGIEVTKNYGYVPQIPCYPDELNQVWTNLIHNAIQAMGEMGSLQIDIEKVSSLNGNPDIDKRNPNYTGDYISVSIQDSGSGIPPEIREKIFQAFFTTKPAGEGSGLGLHIIGKILEKHEGALFLESVPGRTRFSVLLPVG